MAGRVRNSALDAALSDDGKVLIRGYDVADEHCGCVVKVSNGLSSKYVTSRVRSTPISEQAIQGAAVGAAIVGMRPVAEIMLMNFITVAMDQLVNHAAKLRFMSGGQTNVPLVEIGRHTSDLQSLMRISYAVFCLKKKTIPENQHIIRLTTLATP